MSDELKRYAWAYNRNCGDGFYCMTGDSLLGVIAEARQAMLRDVLAFLRDECVQFHEAADNIEARFHDDT